MAIVLFLLALVGTQPAGMEVDQGPAAYCGGAGGGGDDGDDDDGWGNWKGQWLLKIKKPTTTTNKTLVILLSTLEMGAQSLMSKMNIGFGWSRTRVILIMMTGQTLGSLMKPLLSLNTYPVETKHSGTFFLGVPTASSKGGHYLL